MVHIYTQWLHKLSAQEWNIGSLDFLHPFSTPGFRAEESERRTISVKSIGMGLVLLQKLLTKDYFDAKSIKLKGLSLDQISWFFPKIAYKSQNLHIPPLLDQVCIYLLSFFCGHECWEFSLGRVSIYVEKRNWHWACCAALIVLERKSCQWRSSILVFGTLTTMN